MCKIMQEKVVDRTPKAFDPWVPWFFRVEDDDTEIVIGTAAASYEEARLTTRITSAFYRYMLRP